MLNKLRLYKDKITKFKPTRRKALATEGLSALSRKNKYQMKIKRTRKQKKRQRWELTYRG